MNYNPLISLSKISKRSISNKLLYRRLYRKLLKTLGAPKVLSTELSIGDIAYAIGAHDALQCLRALPIMQLNRHFVVDVVVPMVDRDRIRQGRLCHDCVMPLQTYIDGRGAEELIEMTKFVYACADNAGTDLSGADAAFVEAFGAAFGDRKAVRLFNDYSDYSDYAAYAAEIEQQKKEIIEVSPLHYFAP